MGNKAEVILNRGGSLVSDHILIERRSLVNQLKSIESRLGDLDVDNFHRTFLLREKEELLIKLRNIKTKIKGAGGAINDRLREVCFEAFPREVYNELMDEANTRVRTGEMTQLNIPVLYSKDIDDLSQREVLNTKLAHYEVVFQKLRLQIKEEMPELGKITDNSEYLKAVGIQKILNRIIKLLP